MTTPRLAIFAVAFATITLAACGGGEEPSTTSAEPTTEQVAPTPEPTPEPEVAVTFDGPTFELTMTPVGNEMKFEQTEFTVQPGQTVHITFNNTADNPAMSHNVVVLRSTDVINAVGQAAMGAAATDYIPAARRDDIIANTSMSAPGETVEVTFTAPSTAGDYPFICTFPGHYMTMQGTMHVAG